MADLSKIGERERLKPKAGDEPHWQRLRAGCFVGYRPSKRGGTGTWFARAYDGDTSKYQRKALGDYGASTGHERFVAAKKDAEAFAELVETGGVQPVDMVTVADACRAYLSSVSDPNRIAEGVFRRHVVDAAIGKVRLDKLRRHHLRAWRNELENAPAAITRGKGGEVRSRVRAKSTVNRDMVPLRAALRLVLAPGAPGTDAAWQEALRPHRSASGRRTLYLDRAERKRLVEAAELDAQPFLEALCLLPLRPGALAARTAGDFDKRTRTLTIGTDKAGHARRIALPVATADFLVEHAKGKLPAAPLFGRAGGRAWDRNTWGDAISAAGEAAKLPRATCAYTLRHSAITDLVSAGLPLLTVARISGTSAAMIEAHYGHLVGDAAEQALAGLAL